MLNGLFPRVLVLVALACVSCGKASTAPTAPAPDPSEQRSTGPIAFVSDRDGTDQIYLANEDGSGVTRLTPGSAPSWSRDGQRLAFHNAQEIYVINVDGSGRRRVARGWEPAWSPDGLMLVFRQSGVSVVGVDGSNQRRLHDDGGVGSFEPAWSPDGRRIAFGVGTYLDFGLGLRVMNADGSDPHQIGPDAVGAGRPAWSPDGSEIAFVDHLGDIGVMTADDAGQRPRVAGQARDVDWTPEGRLIFTRSATSEWLAPGRRVFIKEGGSEWQLIGEATAPANRSYSDSQATWRR